MVNGQWTGTRIDYGVEFHNQSLMVYPSQSIGELADFLPEFYHVHGDSDYVIDVDLTRCFTRELGKKGFRYIYRELDGVNHSKVFQGDPINIVVNDDVFRWIHATRTRSFPLAKRTRQRSRRSKGIATMSNSQAIPLIKKAARIGGPQAGEASSRHSIPGTPMFVTPQWQVVTLQAMVLPLLPNLAKSSGTKTRKKTRTLGSMPVMFLAGMQNGANSMPENHNRRSARYIFYAVYQVPTYHGNFEDYELMIPGNMHDDRKMYQALHQTAGRPGWGSSWLRPYYSEKRNE